MNEKIPYEWRELVERAARNARPKVRKRYRWAVLMDVFACGSTVAWNICKEFGLDPDEEIKRK